MATAGRSRFALTVRPLVVLAAILVARPPASCSGRSPRSCRRSRIAAPSSSLGFAPEGRTIDYTDHYAKRIEDALASKRPLVERIFLVIGFGGDVTRAIGFARLVDWDKRTVKQQQVVGQLAPVITGIPGLLAFPTNPPSLGQSPVDKPVQFVLQTSQPYDVLQKGVDQLLAAARQNPGLAISTPTSSSTSRSSTSPVSPSSVWTSTTARSANGSCTPTEFSSGGSANATGVTVTAEMRSALIGAICPDHFPKASRSIIESRPSTASAYSRTI